MTRSLSLAVPVALALLVVATVALAPVADWIEAYRTWMVGLGAWGYLAFVALYAAVALACAPTAALSLGAGLAWGLASLPLVVFAATVAGVACFLVGRHVAREPVRALVARDRRARAVERAVAEGGWRIVVLLRLSPLLPFGVQSYLASLTGVALVPYTAATALAITPASAMLVYTGSLGREIERAGPVRWVALGVGLAATAAMVVYVSRRARGALDELAREATLAESVCAKPATGESVAGGPS